jgi:dihydroflavonol-4-reductase
MKRADAEADLQDTGIWQKLMDGMDYVQHIASPFPKVMPKDENDKKKRIR